MTNTKKIKAILFDSGRVLNYPKTGHWHIPPRTFEYINKGEFDNIPEEQIIKAFHLGLKYLNDNHNIQTESEELKAFIQFYTIIFSELDQLTINNETILNISKDTVYNNDKFVFYDDLYEYLPIFRESYALGIVSDTWPSLERVYREVGLMHYFSAFVMSSVLGVCKPNKLMFTTALDKLNIKPEEAIFVDDSYENCIGAEQLGIRSILMIRSNWEKNAVSDLICIRGLEDLYNILHDSSLV